MLPNFEYCCLKCSWNPVKSTSIGLKVSYHNLASPVRVKQNLCTSASYGKLCVSIQSFILNKCAIASSSGLPENSGLKYDQFNCGIFVGRACGCIGLGGLAGGLSGCIGICGGGFGGRFGGREGSANVQEDLEEVVDWVCVTEGLCLEEGLDPVPDLQVLLPLAVLMEDLALKDSILEGFVLEGFSEFLFLLLGQLFLLDQLLWIL